jgi:hypothetical protein
MSKIVNHIKRVDDLVKEWLQPDNMELKSAIDRTVDEGYFSMEDVRHQIIHLRNSVNSDSLKHWAERSGLRYGSMEGKNILCLHAGNLPLVGFQDVLAVAMTKGNYFGKISRKDPYLLPSFLKIFEESEIADCTGWSTDLESLKKVRADSLIFAGSKKSAQSVEEKLTTLSMISPKTPLLMRTAHFSIAWITGNQKKTMEYLTEAVFRYGGNGCRSVAMVVAPFGLNSQKCTFTDYIELFWMRYPQHQKPSKKLYHRYAYNKAVEIEQAWLDDFLIEENVVSPDEKFVLHWVKGGKDEVEALIAKYSDGLQSVYVDSSEINKIKSRETELLELAQKPPIWWQPDQIDTIDWLQTHCK